MTQSRIAECRGGHLEILQHCLLVDVGKKEIIQLKNMTQLNQFIIEWFRKKVARRKKNPFDKICQQEKVNFVSFAVN